MGDLFSVGREMTRPFTSGKHMADVSFDELRGMTAQLTEEERKSPFAKYYGQPMAPLQPAHLEAIAHGPLAPEECYMPELAGEVFLSGGGRFPENGYGVLPNGVGYAAMKFDLEGVTDEMIRKYREEFAQDPYTREHARNLFYKIWFPGAHLIHFEDAVVEDFGWGMMLMEMGWDKFRFQHVGVREEEILRRDPDCIYLLGLAGAGWEVARPEAGERQTCMVQYARQTPWGRELRVRYWNGLRLNPDGTVTLCPAEDRERTLDEMRMMMTHCMTEYCNELKLMKEFWNA